MKHETAVMHARAMLKAGYTSIASLGLSKEEIKSPEAFKDMKHVLNLTRSLYLTQHGITDEADQMMVMGLAANMVLKGDVGVRSMLARVAEKYYGPKAE